MQTVEVLNELKYTQELMDTVEEDLRGLPERLGRVHGDGAIDRAGSEEKAPSRGGVQIPEATEGQPSKENPTRASDEEAVGIQLLDLSGMQIHATRTT